MKPTQPTAYVPGVCNINHAEIAYRRKAGYFGLGVTVVLFVVMLALNLNPWLRILLVVPAYVAVIGFLQAKNKFCVAYGAAGKQNADESSDAATSITDKAAVLRDKVKARSMNLQAAVIALAVALLACLI